MGAFYALFMGNIIKEAFENVRKKEFGALKKQFGW